MRGAFITFEGLDGSGKTIQAKLLSSYLMKSGYDVLLTYEPGGTYISDQIRAILLDSRNADMAAKTDLLLYLASRAQHVEEKLKPALETGKIVVCERFSDSTIVYQSCARGLPLEFVELMDQFSTGGLKPDLTILLDIDVTTSLARLKPHMRDRIEREPTEFYEKIREGYLGLARKEPDRIKLVQAGASIKQVQEVVQKLACDLLRNRKIGQL